MYLDHAATTTIRPIAWKAFEAAMQKFDRNASGQHSEARRAKNALEEARERAASLLGMEQPHDIVFTGSGTEADNLAVIGASLGSSRCSVAVSAVEHDAVLNAAFTLERAGFSLHVLPVSRDGVLDLDALSTVDWAPTAVVSVIAANNEVGVIQPIAQIAEIIRRVDPGALIHTDAVQAFNSEVVTFEATGADLISLSAHKFGGPKGIGLLAMRQGVRIDPIIHGGGQEAGRRAGTHNVAGIVAMVAAMEEAVAKRAHFREHLCTERDALESVLLSGHPGAEVTAQNALRLPHISHIRFPGTLAETFLIRLDQAGIAASAGPACQSGAAEPSHVLTAMGFSNEEARECIRFSFGWDTPPGTGERAGRMALDVLGAL